jgi:polar amino acid transport system permease protein
VPRTQEEAAACLALNWPQRMAHVILPQAVKIATPPTIGFMVQIVKNTSRSPRRSFHRAGTRRADDQQRDLPPFVVFMLIAALYFALCYPLSAWSRHLEGKFDVAHR